LSVAKVINSEQLQKKTFGQFQHDYQIAKIINRTFLLLVSKIMPIFAVETEGVRYVRNTCQYYSCDIDIHIRKEASR
jgi:hypothetical protein